jgi:L-fuculokinase
VPIKIISQKETTVLGASLFVQAACGNFSSPEEAISAIDYKTEIIEPEYPPTPPQGGLKKE